MKSNDLVGAAKSWIKQLAPPPLLNRYGIVKGEPFAALSFAADADIRSDIEERLGYHGPLVDLYSGELKESVHKWHHYLPLYERYFNRFRQTPVKFLEIGVSKGGSLQMWRQYFGEAALIYGIDINPACKAYDGIAGQVRIGSQDDRAFLEAVVGEMGGVDVILDDGSHHMKHIKATLEALFPRLNNGGLYLIEDLHTAYWHGWGGGYASPSNFFNTIRSMVDDMHHWYHDMPIQHPALSPHCPAIHIHDSIVVLEKDITHKPTHSLCK